MKKILLFAILLLSATCHAQTDEANRLKPFEPKNQLMQFVANVEKFAKSYPQEKVYLHLDNTGYFMEERIWFKAYVIRDYNLQHSELSKVLYVELINPSGEVVKTEKLKIVDGEADGYIDLNHLLVSGFYEIRAYTSYMLNWGTTALFSRVLPILEKPDKDGDYEDRRMDEFGARNRLPDYREKEQEGGKKMNVAFYPEGGHLVSGLENRVAFSVTDEDGAHIETEGYLESGGRRICSVKTLREGRGVFSCTPGSERLTLHLTNEKGNERTFRLPDAEQEGCLICAETTDDDIIMVDVLASPQYRSQKMGLVAMNNGRIMRFDEMAGIGLGQRIEIRKLELGNGVSQLALIDSLGNILASRMVFVCKKTGIGRINVQLQNEFLKPYGKISLTAQTIPGSHFSIAVRDYHSQVDGWQADLASWLLLSSDLKGYIENAKYYVEADDEEHRRAADLLMMVQGWQRYNLPLMGSGESFKLVHPLERSLFFEGAISKSKKKIIGSVDGVNLWATYMTDRNNPTDSMVYEDMYLTDGSGHFQFKAPDFYGERDVVMRPEKDNKLLQFDFRFNRGYEPSTRHVFKNELLPIPIDTPRVWNDWRDPDTLLSLGKREFMLSQVNVRGKYKFNQERYWLNEQNAFNKSSIYYDCAKEYEQLRDKGEKFVDFLKWLEKRNPYFSGNWPHEEEDIRKLTASYSHRAVYPRDGMSYKRRPVVWIVNNMFNCITYAPAKLTDNSIMSGLSGYSMIPDELRNVKSVYISEEGDAWKRFVTIPDLEGVNAATVFVYRSSGGNRWESLRKGIRAITLQGYQIPETYKSPNYRVVPSIPDFRRTLYWNPNVKTDEKGLADIVFYNNRACRQLIISAEGFTKEGLPIVY